VFDHGWPDLYRVDLDNGHPELVMHGDKDTGGWVVGPGGVVVASERYDQRSGTWRLFAGGPDGKVVLERSSPLDDIALIGPGRTEGTVLIADNTGDRSTAEEISLKDGASTQLRQDENVEGYLYDPVTLRLIGARTVGEPGAVFFAPQLEAHYTDARKAFAELHMRLESYSRDLGRMIVRTDGTGDSGTYWVVDLASGRAQPVGQARPDIKPQDVGASSVFRYKASDGLEMDGVLTLPRERTPGTCRWW
jgi:dipeptidyl aminopeptidase/acylaminoacyl peptidase